MDDRTFWLTVGVMLSTVLVVLVAGVARFDVSPGFWAIPGGIITLLITISNRKGNGNGG